MRLLPIALCCVLAACAGRQRPEAAAEFDNFELRTFRATTAAPPEPEPFGPGESFEISCDVPIPDANDDLAIDRNCPDYGLGQVAGQPAPEGKMNQARAKNNFCGEGPPVDLTIANFRQLHALLQNLVQWSAGGKPSISDDRSELAAVGELGDEIIGEGRVVRVIGYVREATTTYENPSTGGEYVNCKQRGIERNDFHVNIGATEDADVCSGIVVEFSPHFRPAEWYPAKLRALIQDRRPIRVTGALFVDDEHTITTCGKPGSSQPKRGSLWEVHPIYVADVCRFKSKSSCGIDNEAAWVPLADWQ